ncbi:lengsin isoform X2 [Periophthalmus magnuspinnatus]|uniref:lengsin isoform X2 n=1 Tax=Periophthalmus magnuspinnatus TaxID=409849 RepID=UPI0024368531|nr:lengsin isoform X2 [Periophthalmus magnuspinnatus]
MSDPEASKDQERKEDQVDGAGVSSSQKKSVQVTGRVVNDEHRAVETTGTGGARETNTRNIPKQTMEELKSILRDSAVWDREEGRARGAYTYLHSEHERNLFSDDRTNNPGEFSTFRPQQEASRRGGHDRDSTPIELLPQPRVDSSSTFRPELHSNRGRAEQAQYSRTCHREHRQHTDPRLLSLETVGEQRFVSSMEKIKQQIARENITFVRFEATDLHGVSRSKTVPVRFFHEKAVYGVPMPRSYLELTLSPKSNEVDHGTTANFSSDILLIPDLSTFRAVPWAEQTARVICDPCTVAGNPLRTSPRLIAKQLLGQLQSMGFSLHSSFTYECCVLGAPDRIGPKTLLFPATTLLSNHDLPFFQQLVDSMYCMGADIDSIASASGPGQMEINLRPEFGISAADSAFTFRTGIKEMARKHSYIASFFTDDGLYNAGVLSHSLWDANGQSSLFHIGDKPGDLSEIGRKWLAGLLTHSAALSCLMSPGLGCRSHMAKTTKDPKRMLYATCGCNDNSTSFNIKSHGGRETHIDNKLGSAMANPYVVLAATVAAGLDGIRRNINLESGLTKAPGQQKEFAIPIKLDEALEALAEDQMICSALGEPFVQYFIAMKKFEIETQELDDERNKCLEYFI